MNNEEKLLALRKLGEKYLKQSEGFIREIVPTRLETELDQWISQRRLMDPAIFINRAICHFKKHSFGEQELKISVLAGSAAAVSDDFVDSQLKVAYDRLMLFGKYEGVEEIGNLGLFYIFNQGLVDTLPADFRTRFKETIYEYNKAQEESAKLFDPTISKKEIKSIKDRTGGYSVLLLHAMLFPEESVTVSEPDYHRTPTSKQEALYNFGAWLSRVDDLWDVANDSSRGMKQLSTEEIVTWDSLPAETQRMSEGLEAYFREGRAKEMIQEYYAPLIDVKIFAKYGAAQRLCAK